MSFANMLASGSETETPYIQLPDQTQTETPSQRSKRPLASNSETWTRKVDDQGLHGKYKVELIFFLETIDPKSGQFELNVQFKWFVRMPRGSRESMSAGCPKMRVPSCRGEVYEERQWIDEGKSTEEPGRKTDLWMGATRMTLSGYELFEVYDFPLDRQLINIKVLDFRWVPSDGAKQTRLDVVDLEVKTVSTQPTWQPYTAWVLPTPKRREYSGPWAAGRFDTQLRFERNPGYYLNTIFWVSYLILAGSLLPLGMDATEIGDRLSVFSAGMLTLVLFKYGLSEQLPSVSYSTFADKWLTLQIVSLFVAMADALIGYRAVDAEEDKDKQSEIVTYWKSWDTYLLNGLIFGWLLYFLVHYVLWRCFDGVICEGTPAWRLFGRRPWAVVKETQEQEYEEAEGS